MRSLTVFLLFALLLGQAPGARAAVPASPSLTLIGHASVRIVTPSGTVVYVDPYHPGDYSLPADLILVSHEHSDHNKVSLVTPNEGCLTLRVKQAVNPDGSYNAYEHAGVRVEPVPAYNKNHNRKQTCGFLITFEGITVYFAGDTNRVPEMESLAGRGIDYALFPIDGQYNMGAAEAMECAALIGARHNIPMHFFNADPKKFTPENLLFIPYGETVALAAAEAAP